MNKMKLPLLSKKSLTKLLDADFRNSILTAFSNTLNNKKYGIIEYAKYVVDSQIMSRAKNLENDKKSYFGFSPINVLCAIDKNGKMITKFFEFKVINHFLKEYKGNFAIDVVKCILLMWLNENKNIDSFNYMKIDNELAKIEKQYLLQQHKSKITEANLSNENSQKDK